MNWYIIAYGWHGDCQVIEAPSLKDAQAKAAQFSMREGLLDDDLADTTWARAYDDDLACDLGLLGYDDNDHFVRPIPAPWR